MSSSSHHSRQASINSRDFVVPSSFDTEVHSEHDDSDQVSTDSYEDSIAEDDEILDTFDSVKYLVDTLNSALSSVEFTRSIALQAQTSGNLKNKELELLQLQAEAQDQLQDYKFRFKEGLKLLQKVSKDLKWAKNKVEVLEYHVRSKHPIEFAQAKEKILSRSSQLQEIIRHDEAQKNNEQESDTEIFF